MLDAYGIVIMGKNSRIKWSTTFHLHGNRERRNVEAELDEWTIKSVWCDDDAVWW